MSGSVSVTPFDRGTEDKSARKGKKVERLKELFNIWRKYAKLILFITLGILALQWLLNRFAGPVSATLSHISIFGWTPQLRKLGLNIMLITRWLFWLSLLIWYITHSLKIIQPFEHGLITRLGEYNRTRDKGPCVILYPIESIEFVKVYTMTADIAEQPVYTSDNIRIGANAIIWFKIRNAAAAVYNVDDIKESVYDAGYTAIRTAAAKQPIAEINAARDKIKTAVINSFEEVTEPGTVTWPQKQEKNYKGWIERTWLKLKKFLTFNSQVGKEENWGIKIVKVEIQDFDLPKDYEEQQRKIRVAQLKIDEETNLKLAKFQQADAVAYTLQKEGEGRKALIKQQVEALGEKGEELYTAMDIAGKMTQNTKYVGVVPGNIFNGVIRLFRQFIGGGSRQLEDGGE